MKIAIVPISMMSTQLRLWRSEREVAEAEGVLERRTEGTERARRALQGKQQQLFDEQARIETARANIRKILAR